MTNLYCHGQAVGDTFDRIGSCTDRTGTDPACPLPFLSGTRHTYLLVLVVGDQVHFAYGMATQTLVIGTGLVTRRTLPTAGMEHFV